MNGCYFRFEGKLRLDLILDPLTVFCFWGVCDVFIKIQQFIRQRTSELHARFHLSWSDMLISDGPGGALAQAGNGGWASDKMKLGKKTYIWSNYRTSHDLTPKGSLVRESYWVSPGHFGRRVSHHPTRVLSSNSKGILPKMALKEFYFQDRLLLFFGVRFCCFLNWNHRETLSGNKNWIYVTRKSLSNIKSYNLDVYFVKQSNCNWKTHCGVHFYEILHLKNSLIIRVEAGWKKQSKLFSTNEIYIVWSIFSQTKIFSSQSSFQSNIGLRNWKTSRVRSEWSQVATAALRTTMWRSSHISRKLSRKKFWETCFSRIWLVESHALAHLLHAWSTFLVLRQNPSMSTHYFLCLLEWIQRHP